MNKQSQRILVTILVPILAIALWVAFCWPPDKHIMLFFPIGAFTFWATFGAGIYLSRTVQRIDQSDRITLKGEFDDEPNLWTLNGIGTRFVGVSGNPYVKYQFFCFFYIPLCPIGCYAAKTDGENYMWYGYAKWSILEVIGIYMKWWGGLMGIMFTIYSFFGLFSE